MQLAELVRDDGKTLRGQPSLASRFSAESLDAIVAQAPHASRFAAWLVVQLDQAPSTFTKSQRLAAARFIGALASDSPAICYLPVAAASAMRTALSSSALSPEQLQLLQLDAPLVAEVISMWAVRGDPLGVEMRPIWERLAHLTLDVCAQGDGAGELFLDIANQPSSKSQLCLETGICCGLPRVRPRYACQQDGAEKGGSSADASCRHSFTAGSKGSHRTGGVFTWFCRHGICYAFYMLPGAEGRDEAYSFLVSYFRKAPKVVVYDFACSLQEYCLNRAPGFFRDTAFLVDRFHWWNHKACSPSYNVSLYKQLDYLNTQVAEQCNSALQRIKPCVSQMLQVNFMFNMRLFLDIWNQKKIAKLAEVLEHVASNP